MTGLLLMQSVLTPLAKTTLLLMGLSAGMSVADEVTRKKVWGSGTAALITSNEEMEVIMKIVTHLKNQNY